MDAQEYLNSMESRVDVIARDIRELSKKVDSSVEGGSQEFQEKTKALLQAAEVKVEKTKKRIEEYSLRRDLAVDEAKSGIEMATDDLKETFNSIKRILQ